MTSASGADLLEAIRDNPIWYHTMELPGGVVTPGWFDLRPILEHLPWPDLTGLRCLDIGTYDGHLAFEMERRGAAEVVALDVGDHDNWDWPPDVRAYGGERLAMIAGEKGRGFEIAAAALGSSVRKVVRSIYDLDPASDGQFDFIICGSLLLHLRDPMRALEAVRGVCRGHFLSAETIDLPLTVFHPRVPLARLNGMGDLCQWWTPNAAGHQRMVRSAGFALDRVVKPYSIPMGSAHPPPGGGLRSLRTQLARRVFTGNHGVPHSAVLAHPAV